LTFNTESSERSEEKQQQPKGWTQFGDEQSRSSVTTMTTTTTTTNGDLNELLGFNTGGEDIQSQKSEELFGESESSDGTFGMTTEQKQKKAEQSKNSILQKFKENQSSSTMQRTRSQPVSTQDFLTQLPPNAGMSGPMGIPNHQLMMQQGMMNPSQAQMNQYGMMMNNNGYGMGSNQIPLNNGMGMNVYTNVMNNQYSNSTLYSGGIQPTNNAWGQMNGRQPSNRTQNGF